MNAPDNSSLPIELRIHGVSGTPVVSLLDVSTVHRVAGDDDAGFWRVGDFGDDEAPTDTDTVLEGYRWGGLTSGAAKAAVWVFLAPFALVNAAAAAHLPGHSKAEHRDGIAPGIEGTLVRLFALSLSLTLVLTIYISTVDIVGWQCGNPLDPNHPQNFCTRHPSYTHFLSWHIFDTPARHIVVTMLGPLLVLGLVWFLARKSWQRYESYPSGSAHEPLRRDETTTEPTPFDKPGFWNGRDRAETLRHLHIAACLAGLSAMVLWARLAVHPQNRSKTVVPILLVIVLLVLAAVILVTAVTSIPGRRAWAAGLLIGAAAMMAVTLETTWFANLHHTTETPTGATIAALPAELPGVATVVTLLFAVQLGLVVVLGLNGLWTKHESPAPLRKIGLKGCSSVCLCVIALVLAGAFSAGAIIRVADLFGAARPHTEIGSRALGQIVTPDAFTWMARGTVGAALVVVAWAIVVGSLQYRDASKLSGEYYKPLESIFPDDVSAKVRDAAGAERTKKVRRTIALAQLTDRAGRVLGPAAVIAFVFAGLATVFALLADSNHGPGFLKNPSGNAWRTWTASAGAWLIVGFAGALVGLTVSAYRKEDKRRQVGVLWDVVTFWPRSAHPLGPPCYAERTVPEYAARATFHRYGALRFDANEQDPNAAVDEAKRLRRPVILSAHSQGTIIAAAALLQLIDTTGLGLVTYGCPLERLYARYFPSYFGGPTLDILAKRLTTPSHEPRWRNLYRETDPIGAWVFVPPEPPAPTPASPPTPVTEGGKVDVFVPIPSSITPGDTVYPAIEGHSRYPREPLYSKSLVEVRDMT